MNEGWQKIGDIVSSTKVNIILEKVNAILLGIDKTEVEHEQGWWKTSGGATFGKKKLEDLKTMLKEELL